MLDNEEKEGMLHAPYDKNRVSFHVWKGDEYDSSSYFMNAFFAAPTTVLEGFVPAEDLDIAGRAISAFKKDGIEIPLEQGLLFMTPNLLLSNKKQLERNAESKGLSFKDYVNSNIVILSEDAFKSTEKLWEEVSSRISPARGVTVEIVSREDQTTFSDGKLSLTKAIEDAKGSGIEELGVTRVLGGDAVSISFLNSLQSSWKSELKWLEEVDKNLEEDPFHIEGLREKRLGIDDYFDLVIELTDLDEKLSEINKLRGDYHELRKKVLERNEQILEQKYPDVTQEEKGGKFELRRPPSKPEVVRGEDGKLHVITPI